MEEDSQKVAWILSTESEVESSRCAKAVELTSIDAVLSARVTAKPLVEYPIYLYRCFSGLERIVFMCLAVHRVSSGALQRKEKLGKKLNGTEIAIRGHAGKVLRCRHKA